MSTLLQQLANGERDQLHITAIKVIQLKEHGIQSLVKVETDGGVYGLGEIGAPAAVARAYIETMKADLIGQDALAVEKCYADMTRMRAQWHAHWVQNPTISGIDIALWDIAGKVFNRPISKLLTGRFRDEIELYVNTLGPTDWFDKGACQAWADELKADSNGFQTIKFGFEAMIGRQLPQHSGRRPGYLCDMLKQTELRRIRQGYENCREALGWEMDIIVHCHNEWDLPTALGIAEAVAPIRPLWIEDALPVVYSASWPAFRAASPVRVMTGEKLELVAEFLQFLTSGGVHVIHPDIAFVGGITGMRKIADLAELYAVPVVTHNVGSLVQLLATAHFGASCRNFVMTECRIPQGGIFAEMNADEMQVANGKLTVPDKPGLGITLVDAVLRANLWDDEVYWK